MHLVGTYSKQRRMTTLVIVRHLVPGVSEVGWDEIGMWGAHHSSFGCHVAAGNMERAFRMHPLAVFVHVGIHSCSFWGGRHCYGGRHRCW